MVYPRFLVSSQPFFIFNGCLMSIIKPEGSSESNFSMKRARCRISFTNLARCSLNRKNGRHEMKQPWDSTTDVFLDLPRHILEVATTEEHNKRETSVVGWSGCGLSINMKCAGKRTSAVKNCGYFPACSAVMMLKIEARSVCTRTRGCSSA